MTRFTAITCILIHGTTHGMIPGIMTAGIGDTAIMIRGITVHGIITTRGSVRTAITDTDIRHIPCIFQVMTAMCPTVRSIQADGTVT